MRGTTCVYAPPPPRINPSIASSVHAWFGIIFYSSSLSAFPSIVSSVHACFGIILSSLSFSAFPSIASSVHACFGILLPSFLKLLRFFLPPCILFVPISTPTRRALYQCWWGREYTLDLPSEWDGHRLGGVLLVGGGAGDQAVVGSADGFRPRKQFLVSTFPLWSSLVAVVVVVVDARGKTFLRLMFSLTMAFLRPRCTYSSVE